MKKSIAKKVRALLALTLDLQAPDFQVFFDYSPHVDKVEIRVFAGGWVPEGQPTNRGLVYLDSDYGGTPEEQVQDLIDSLKRWHKQFREARRETAAAAVL
jgi:hypothetical protein